MATGGLGEIRKFEEQLEEKKLQPSTPPFLDAEHMLV